MEVEGGVMEGGGRCGAEKGEEVAGAVGVGGGVWRVCGARRWE